MDELVSVIVPIYNVEKYLPKCVDSIISQKYTNLEIILVDDGSPDKSGDIADQYAKKDERIHVIHKKNGGLSDARNAGIDAALGEYLVFIDSDDYIHPEMISRMMDAVKKTSSDMAVCAVRNVRENETVPVEIEKDTITVIQDMDKRTEYFFEDKYVEFTVAWNKLYPASYFREVRYPYGKIHEDEFTTWKIFEMAERIVYIEAPLYYYVQRDDSIMGSSFNEKRFFRLEAYDERLEYYFKSDYRMGFEKILFFYRVFLLNYAKKIREISMDDTLLKKYRVHYRQWVFRSLLRLPVTAKKKLGYLLSVFRPEFYFKCY